MTEQVKYCVGCHSRYNYVGRFADIFSNELYCPKCTQLIFEALHKTHKVKSNVKFKYKEVVEDDDNDDVLKKIKEEIIDYRTRRIEIMSGGHEQNEYMSKYPTLTKRYRIIEDIGPDAIYEFPDDCCTDLVFKKVINHHVYHVTTSEDIHGEIRVFEVLDVDVNTNEVIGYHVSDEVDSDIVRIGYSLFKDSCVEKDFKTIDMDFDFVVE